jgi:hypothetical protein
MGRSTDTAATTIAFNAVDATIADFVMFSKKKAWNRIADMGRVFFCRMFHVEHKSTRAAKRT